MSASEETETLKALIKAHDGNHSAIGRELGVTRQAVEAKLKKLGMLHLSVAARTKAGIPGTRKDLDEAPEREKILKVLRRSKSDEDAAEALGVNRATLYRQIERYGIKDEASAARASR